MKDTTNPKEDEMKTVLLSQEIQNEIVRTLKSFDPYKIILFGSYAYGTPDEESDIDLVVINNEESYKSFAERMEIKIEILKKLDRIKQPIDVLAYTKKEWEDLIVKNSSFIREISEKGVLLESVA